jgi:hypothetical protein
MFLPELGESGNKKMHVFSLPLYLQVVSDMLIPMFLNNGRLERVLNI